MEVYQYRNNPQRYSVIKDDNTATLKIENVRSSDAGEYQCEARGQTNGWILRRTINLGQLLPTLWAFILLYGMA